MDRTESNEVIFQLLNQCVKSKYNVDLAADKKQILSKFEPPKDLSIHDHQLAVPCFALVKSLIRCKPKTQPVPEFCKSIAEELGPLLTDAVEKDSSSSSSSDNDTKALPHPSEVVDRVATTGPYINFYFKTPYMARILDHILEQQSTSHSTPKGGNILHQRPPQKDVVMIEYSQPNTHKAFHVGHMRNAALGNSLANLFAFAGHKVIAANYIGDIGAHIAKCLWYYIHRFEPKSPKGIAGDAPEDVQLRSEWLGDLYNRACEALDLARYTELPFPKFLSARITAVEDHPSNSKWKVVKLTIGQGDDDAEDEDGDGKTQFSVVCGGKGYHVGDIVAYAPLGSRKGGRPVVEQDMKGAVSQGMILSEKELERSENKDQIYIFPSGTPVGVEIVEIGRKMKKDEGDDAPLDAIPEDVNLWGEIEKRDQQVKAILKDMEDGEPEITKLWEETRMWSIEAFKEIYDWVGCHFDHDFHESDVGEESKRLVLKAYEEGKLVMSDGAIGADLSKYKLGFSILLTSAGNGLYATKDLSLAEKKFAEFNVDRSIYVVDDSQSLHFAQVFKTLEILGFEQAKQCYHLPYGLVVLPDGKMSSRKGNVIYFSKLKDMLQRKIYKEFFSKYEEDPTWSKEEIEQGVRRVAVATIKWGMLNQDNKKTIVFDMEEWTARTGNTGPYQMYAYARTRSIIREVGMDEETKRSLSDWNLLTNEHEKNLLAHLLDFTDVVNRSVEQYRPQLICIYLFDLAKQFSRMYENVSVKGAETEALKATRLSLVEAVGLVIQKGLDLLGIETLEKM